MTGVAIRPLLQGNHYWGRPVLEKGTPVNEGNQPLRDNGEAVANGHCLTLCHNLAPGVSPGTRVPLRSSPIGAKDSVTVSRLRRSASKHEKTPG